MCTYTATRAPLASATGFKENRDLFYLPVKGTCQLLLPGPESPEAACGSPGGEAPQDSCMLRSCWEVLSLLRQDRAGQGGGPA